MKKFDFKPYNKFRVSNYIHKKCMNKFTDYLGVSRGTVFLWHGSDLGACPELDVYYVFQIPTKSIISTTTWELLHQFVGDSEIDVFVHLNKEGTP